MFFCPEWFGSFLEGKVGVWLFILLLLLLSLLAIGRYARARFLMTHNMSENPDFPLQLLSAIAEFLVHLLMSWLLGWPYQLALMGLSFLACNRFFVLCLFF